MKYTTTKLNDANKSMKLIVTTPTLVDQVYSAILSEISKGIIPPGERIIQEVIAKDLGVSRQPVQQALLLLRNQGILQDAPGRGLVVAPLDVEYVRQMYDVRAVLEGLACRNAAAKNSARAKKEGPNFIKEGLKAVKKNDVSLLIDADHQFHQFIYELSDNSMIGSLLDSQWSSTQRIMGEGLLIDQKPSEIWEQHANILDAIVSGDADFAEKIAKEHISRAANFVVERLAQQK
jgi:DNA-binding GntR family transcriptional regulator